MPEPLKNLYNKKFITGLADELEGTCREFNKSDFVKNIFDKEWKQKELKQRMRHITQTIHTYMPNDYRKAIKILMPASAKFEGFEPMFFPDYVECYGLNDFEASIPALEWMTQFSSSEFAVRPFIVKHPKKMMQQMVRWANHENHHVRRLASEGCRPRLPWAMALPEFKRDPQPVLKVLNKLKADKSEYVRRSVANNLNDISKDHPDLVVEIAKQWMGVCDETDGVIKHGCRTLLKNSDHRVLRLFGYRKPGHVEIKNFRISPRVKVGANLDFSFKLKSRTKNLGKLRIEYAIDFVRANKKSSTKMFKISEGVYSGDEKRINRNHSFRLITTRKYYPGRHAISLYVNGHQFDRKEFSVHE